MTNPRSGNANCFVIGCVGAVIAAVLVVVGVGGAMWWGFNRMVKEYTDTEPLELPEVALTQEDYEALRTRIEEFGEKLDAGTAEEPFVISDEEINAVLKYSEEMQPLGQHLRIQFEQDTAYATLSLPMDEWGWEGRYLNGRGVFDVYMRRNEIFVVPISFEVGGEPLPDYMMEGFKGQNMLDDAQGQVQTDAFSLAVRDLEEQLEGLEVESGQLILMPKSPTAEIETLPSLNETEAEAEAGAQ